MARYRECAADSGNGGADTLKLGAMRQIYVAETDEQAQAVAKPAYEDWYRSITQLWHQNNDHAYDDFFRVEILPRGRNHTDRIDRHSPRSNPAPGRGEWNQLFRRFVRMGLIESGGKPEIA